MQLGSEVVIVVSDNGRGIDLDRVRESAAKRGVDVTGFNEDQLLDVIFHPGVTTAERVTNLSGRGVGLDVVRNGIDAVRGRVEVRSKQGKGTEFRLVVPITMAVLPCILVQVSGQHFAIPAHSVVHVENLQTAALEFAGGRRVLRVEDGLADVFELGSVLGRGDGQERTSGYVVLVSVTSRRVAFVVDSLVGQRDVVVTGLGRLLPRLSVLVGASVEPDGSILLVLDVQGLIDHAVRSATPIATESNSALEIEPQVKVRASILVVDDALTVRELERSILERAGYDVRVAGDGNEALVALAHEPVDLVLTDVEMPGMDGFSLTRAIRADERLGNVPILILTSRASEEDRRQGLEAGADGYIVKSAFDEAALLSAINRVLGDVG